ncbi:hypothetical protein Slala05_54470 [Streptomyces lavendulae subsp. lavendulae]|nr:hypothetical protein Slala05_54470 [Streptomyces lavendulae subsp. lavendulae]
MGARPDEDGQTSSLPYRRAGGRVLRRADGPAARREIRCAAVEAVRTVRASTMTSGISYRTVSRRLAGAWPFGPERTDYAPR